MERILKIKSIFFLFLCSLCFGPSYFFIKVAVPEIPPITLALARAGIAACIFGLLCYLKKENMGLWKYLWKQFLVIGLLMSVFPFYLLSYGEIYISSSLAAILFSLVLIFTAILAHF